jgi:GxxExxY protein
VNEALTDRIIAAAIEVHRQLGPGLLESAYESCLARELVDAGLAFGRQVDVPLVYKGAPVEIGFRADFIVEDSVIVELKSIDRLIPIHEAQLMTYMKLAKVRVGLLFNFNTTRLIDGMVRRVL